MRSVKAVVILSAVVAATGCVPKSQYEQIKTQLETCEKDKATAQASVADYSRQFDGERQRWDTIETNLNKAIPDALKNMEDQRQQLLQAVPEESRKAVGKQLDRYFVNVTRQFDALNKRVEDLQDQLQHANTALASLQTTTEGVGQKVDTANNQRESEMKAERDKIQASLDQTRKAAAGVAGTLLQFDKERIDCDGCLTEIRFKKDGKEVLSAFHADLVAKLNAIGSGSATN